MKQHFFMLIAMIISCYGSSDQIQMSALREAGKSVLKSEWDLAWQKDMSKIADPYFRAKYPRKSNTQIAYVEGTEYTVERPNHGTLHGIRTGLLAVDVARMMEILYPHSKIGTFMRAERDRVGDKIDKKIFFAAMFQRVGRESEHSNRLAWVLNTKEYFETEATKLFGRGGLYDDAQEIEDYGDAQILTLDGIHRDWPNIVGVMSERARIIGDIIHAGHKFDLRRITVFQADRVQRETRQKLGLAEDENILIQIWDLSGLYLRATHDSDMVPGGYPRLDDGFFVLSNDLDRANELLYIARVKFWESMIERVQADATFSDVQVHHDPTHPSSPTEINTAHSVDDVFSVSDEPDVRRSPLEIHVKCIGMPDDGRITTDALSEILRTQHGVELVHGTKANLLLPMLKKTEFEMLNVLDLLKQGTCPMIGELQNGINYNGGVNLRRLDFEDLYERSERKFWEEYAKAKYPVQSVLQDNGRITTTDLKRQLESICNDILDDKLDRNFLKDKLLVKLSIAVTRLKLFDPEALASDSALLGKIESARQRCFEFIDLYIRDLEESIALCDDHHLDLHEDSYSCLGFCCDHAREYNKVLTKKIISAFESHLQMNRLRNVEGHISIDFDGHHESWFYLFVDNENWRKKDDIILTKFAAYLKGPRARAPSSTPGHLHLNAPELTIMVRSFPKVLARRLYDETGAPVVDLSEDWKRALVNTLRYERMMRSVLEQASDPHEMQRVSPLTASEKAFMLNHDIPMVIGTTSYFKENDRNHMKFGMDIDVLVVEVQNVGVVKKYLEREFACCGGVITIFAVEDRDRDDGTEYDSADSSASDPF